MSPRVLGVEPLHDGDSVAEAVRREGVIVDRVDSAAAALAAIASGQHAVLVLDLATPQMNLEQIADALREVTLRPIVLAIADNSDTLRCSLSADVIHGFI